MSWNVKYHEILMLDLWLQAETTGVTHFGAYYRPRDGHFFTDDDNISTDANIISTDADNINTSTDADNILQEQNADFNRCW